MNEISTHVEIVPAVIKFDNFVDLKNEALEVADTLKTIVVTEDTIPSTKKLVAEVRKKVTALDKERKEVKKEINQPLIDFENQVKEINQIVTDAERYVRDQLDIYEESRRASKAELIRIIWDKRAKKYGDVVNFRTYEDFLTPQHLNKGVTSDQIEAEMVTFLESTKEDLEVIDSMDDAQELLIYYGEGNDFTTCNKMLWEKKKRAEEVKQKISSSKRLTSFEANVKLFTQADYDMVVSFCNKNNIKFK
ncbi:gp31 [Listeria phage P35]|uniref:DUF1351 domain-containing protein n=1 Tax=Listeria phage LP-083-1 TaxID=1458854 RepID=A0A059T7Z8_9CAUD|nr:gp31 [Listeria phage P35]AAY53216.1 gp31 [Listeria phage P35]AHL18996.1 DUF1351 domain-containing protein [Listeria phage LP-083-1]